MSKFLPGAPISNEEMEDYLGRIHGKSSRAQARILKQNGIQYRYYAIDKQQQSQYSYAQMAALATRDALAHAKRTIENVDFLAVATSQGDFPLPGFASFVQAN
jgi:3-oxoacyl-[acyl-carrier-protein] synthase-3